MDRFSEQVGGTARGPAAERVRETVTHEAAEEFILPDYLPEIRKILSCTAEALPENKYVDGPCVESSGLVVYSVLYLGNGPELCSAPLQSEYSVKIRVRGGTEGVGARDVGVTTVCESVSCRATGPRSLTLVAKLVTNVLATGRKSAEPAVTAASGGETADPTPADLISIEYLRRPVRCSAARFYGTSGDVSGEFSVPAAQGDGEIVAPAVVRCTGTAYVTDAAWDGGGLRVKGEVRVRALTSGSDGKYFSVDSSAPFEERIDPGAEFSPDGDAAGAAFARLASLTVDDAGGGRFAWTAEYDIDGEIWETGDGEAVCDAFSTACSDETEFVDVDAVRFAGGIDATFSAGSSVPAPSARNRTVVTSSGKVTGCRAEVRDDGTVVFTGNCTVTAVTAGDGAASPEEVTFPVRYERSVPALAGDAGSNGAPDVRWVMKVISTGARLDGDKLSADAEIAVEASVTARERIRAVSGVILKKDEPAETDGNVIRLYYPDEGETAWDIAKRYRVSPDSVSGDNPVVIS
ncbi:MAG: DUF3794 domain-containing protein [Clostridia bacterium]|nr:DUF3794 domain-containing protein [Clostridia bacterium]